MNTIIKKDYFKFLQQNGAWIGLVVLSIYLTIYTHGDFASARNLTNLFRQAALNGILACGMTVVIITGGIDLSVGSLVALAGIVVGLVQSQWGLMEMGMTGAIISVLVGTASGSAAGAVSGGLISRLGVAPFVITLGMMVITRGLAMILSGGTALSPMPDELNNFADYYFSPVLMNSLLAVILIFVTYKFYSQRKKWILILSIAIALAFVFSNHKGLPILALFFAVIAGLTAFLLNQTVWGRSVFAVGSNPKAAYWAGVQIKRTLFRTYLYMGALSGLTGVLLAARLDSADPNAGQLFELDAIAAVVIGGTSLKGGSGSIIGTLLGVLTIAALNNGMDLLGVTSFYQMVFKGLIIIGAVSLDKSQREQL